MTGRAGIKTYGLVLGATDTFVNRNFIDAGCAVGSGEAVGVDAVGAWARLQNNVVRGWQCNTTTTSLDSWALRVTLGKGLQEIDVDSNDLFAMGAPGACTSRAIALLPGGGASGGVYRNNIFHAGFCGTTYAFAEGSSATDPRLFVANDLWYSGAAATALYLDEGSTALTAIAAVNGVTDPTSSSNLSVNPGLQNPATIAYPFPATPDYHLSAASACIDKGVKSVSGPTTDFDFPATPRPSKTAPDIGADEVP